FEGAGTMGSCPGGGAGVTVASSGRRASGNRSRAIAFGISSGGATSVGGDSAITAVATLNPHRSPTAHARAHMAQPSDLASGSRPESAGGGAGPKADGAVGEQAQSLHATAGLPHPQPPNLNCIVNVNMCT